MDRTYIESERIVDRYLSGQLTVREARDFERYCLDHPEFLSSLPIPVRLKARLARRPQDDSETGMFQAIPSSATRAVLEIADDAFDEPDAPAASFGSRLAGGRLLPIVLALALAASLVGLIAYATRASELADRIARLEEEAAAAQMLPPGRVERYRVQPVRIKPDEATLAIGWPNPPELVDLYIDASQGRYTQFRITMDREDGTRVMQLGRVTRDSNRELRLALNSSAFEPGDYFLRIEGYNWRGQTEEVGWVRLGLQ